MHHSDPIGFGSRLSTMPFSAALRSNLLRFVEDLLSYMTEAEKHGQLKTAVLPVSADGQDVLDREVLRSLRAGRVGTVVGPRSRGEARQLQRIAIEETRLGIPLLFAATMKEDAWPAPLTMAASWDPDTVEAVAREAANAATERGLTWLAAPAFASSGSIGSPDYAGQSPYLARRMCGAVIRGVSGDEAGSDLARNDHALALLPDCEAVAPHGTASSATGDVFRGRDFADWHAGSDKSSERLDAAVRRILLAKAQLGLFRDPFNRLDGARPSAPDRDHSARATLTRKAMVLLRNGGDILPLGQDAGALLSVSCGNGTSAAIGEALAAADLTHRRLSGLVLRQDDIENPRALLQADGLSIGIAADAAARSDSVVICVGDAECEPGDGLPRLGPAAAALLAALVHANPRCVLVSATALPLDPASLPPRLAAHLHAWAPGPGFPEALGAILTGASEPTGRLPLSFGSPGQPHAYPFGHGLGYRTLDYRKVGLEFGGDSLVAELEVENSHADVASDTIQIYVRGPNEDDLQLRDFRRIAVPANGSLRLRFELGIDQLGQTEPGGPARVLPGRYAVFLGRDRTDGHFVEADIPAGLARAMSVPAALRDI
ncbi:MAG: glycoside hydrolase family 3 C-terminal domain-containing protein, partial [Erythrobacter sp.]|nr:glycoside hydrolase family 3 C-terminal domain-containing protein [Erythrobacter sp.]